MKNSGKAIPAARDDRLNDSRAIPAALVAIAVSALAAYGNTFGVPLLLDDLTSVGANPSIRHLLSAFWTPINMTAAGRPILNLSLAVNYAISGTQVWSYHVLNLAIHVLSGLTLFGIVRRTLANRHVTASVAIACSVALIWTLHPLQTQAVTYIVQRSESLMGLFYLVTLYCFIRGAAPEERRPTVWFSLSVAACLLGMGTKEVMASAPLIVLLYDRTFLSGSFRNALRLRWRVYGAMAATWLILAALLISTYERGGFSARLFLFTGSAPPMTWWRYALTQLEAIPHYLRLCFWPHPLIFDYGIALARPSIRLIPDGLVTAGLVAATLWAIARRPAYGFLGACFFLILAPTSSIVPLAGETMAEYRMYLPSIVVVLLVVIGLHRKLATAAPAVCGVLAVFLFAVTWQRNTVYHSAESLWGDTVAKVPDNVRARVNLGDALEKIPGREPEAIAQYHEALKLNPQLAIAHYDIGVALGKTPGRLPDAIAEYQEALRIDPNSAEAHDNLGVAYARMKGRLTDAIAQFEAALKIDPSDAGAHNDLGAALVEIPGRLPDAVAHYEAALKIDPDDATASVNLGNILVGMPGRQADAVRCSRLR